MQHFRFGRKIPFEGTQFDDKIETEAGHVHVHAYGQEYPDCCGIRIPSAIASSAKFNNSPNGKLIITSIESNTNVIPFD